MTGLRQRTQAGRPNWDKEFAKIRDENQGKVGGTHIIHVKCVCYQVTVFYCGNPALVPVLAEKCQQMGFDFRKEVF